jgi:DNA invertase Pin-like site-specific DNA recombinase
MSLIAQKEPSVNGLRAALYLRVSTSNQTTENQRIDLEKVATNRGWQIVETFRDEGISGSKNRTDRPALDRMLKEAVRRKFDLIAVWSIDRLGRSLQHLIETVNELQAVGVDLYIHQQAIDTTTPAGKLAFAYSGRS